ncbi:molybdenum cofactor guanylyltransferase MobA [Rhodoligotrophos ferricapiens]|uniref:molybdenum cofactor guanylyltransferase MobA n=1 Tax=Rhodoligotrophos ferricapiens TaxID=3069264 RepID=UPI00315C4F3E
MSRTPVGGVILAGGKGTRLGNVDKALVGLSGKPLISYAIEQLRPQVDALVINANGDPERFARFDLPVIPDATRIALGPLSGIYAGMQALTRLAPQAKWMVTVPCDAPLIPADLVRKLLSGAGDAVIVRAASGGRVHHVVAAWRMALIADLADALDSGIRKVADWAAQYGAAVRTVVFPHEPFDPFLNINRPADLAAAELILSSQP